MEHMVELCLQITHAHVKQRKKHLKDSDNPAQ